MSEPFQPVGKPVHPAPADPDRPGDGGFGRRGDRSPGPRSTPTARRPCATPSTATTSRSPACTDITARVCDNANLTYNGHVYDFAVRATNGGGEVVATWARPPSGARPASPRRGARGACWRPATTTRPAPASPSRPRGGRLDRAGLRRRRQGPPGQPAPEAWTPCSRCPTTSAPHAVSLEVCNEDGACTQSSAQNVQTYGPLVAAHIHSITPTINVRTRLVDHRGRQQRRRGDADRHQRQGPLPGVRGAGRRLHVHHQRDGVRLPADRDGDRHAVRRQPGPRPGDGDQLGHHRAAATAVRGGLEGRRLQRRRGRRPAAVRHRPVRWAQVHGRVVRVRAHHLEQLADRRPRHGRVLLGQQRGRAPLRPQRQRRHPDYYGSPGGTVTVRCENALGQEAQTQLTW